MDYLRYKPILDRPDYDEIPKVIRLKKDQILLGRGKNCDIILPEKTREESVSKEHLLIERTGKTYTLINKSKREGTTNLERNGKFIHLLADQKQVFLYGDIIWLGCIGFRLCKASKARRNSSTIYMNIFSYLNQLDENKKHILFEPMELEKNFITSRLKQLFEYAEIILDDEPPASKHGPHLMSKRLDKPGITVTVIQERNFTDLEKSIFNFVIHQLRTAYLEKYTRSLEKEIHQLQKEKQKDAEYYAKKLPDYIIGNHFRRSIGKFMVRYAETPDTIFIHGETGTGKELIAQAIHDISPRKDQKYLAVNISSISKGVMESELFGHEKGAFTYADKARKGLFEEAGEGTIFLDEIGDLPYEMQVKFLRILREKEILRVGSSQKTDIQMRIICATNKDLQEEVEQGKFREDLYYRLIGFTIELPPLRERKADIPALLSHFLSIYNQQQKKYIKITQDAEKLLTSFYWRGNVAEVKDTVRRLASLCENNQITQDTVQEDPQLKYYFQNSSKTVLSSNSKKLGVIIEQVHQILKDILGDQGHIKRQDYIQQICNSNHHLQSLEWWGWLKEIEEDEKNKIYEQGENFSDLYELEVQCGNTDCPGHKKSLEHPRRNHFDIAISRYKKLGLQSLKDLQICKKEKKPLFQCPSCKKISLIITKVLKTQLL